MSSFSRTIWIPRFAGRLLEEHPERVGYLLKERLSDIAVLKDALHRIGMGNASSMQRSSRVCYGAAVTPTRWVN